MTRTPLAREIALILIFKIAALAALYGLFFTPKHRFKPSATQMVEHFASSSSGVPTR